MCYVSRFSLSPPPPLLYPQLTVVPSLQTLNLMVLNKLKRRQRVSNGKPASIRDISMEKKYEAAPSRVFDDSKMETSTSGVHLGDMGLLDLTDRENDEVCVLAHSFEDIS